MLHAHMHKKELVDRIYHLDICISYDRVLHLLAEIGSRVCEQFHRVLVVCPSKLCGSVFTSAAVDNIDHNPRSTTSKESFHGTGISLFQYPTYDSEGVDQSIIIIRVCQDVTSKPVDDLPNFYTNVPQLMKVLRSHLF